MKGRLAIALAAGLGILLLGAPAALGAFGFSEVDFRIKTAEGTPETLAGSHPFAIDTSLAFNTTIDPELGEIPEDQVRDVIVTLPEGFGGDVNAVPPCSNADFLATPGGDVEDDLRYTTCPNATVIGLATLNIGYTEPGPFYSPVYNLVPGEGMVQRLGFVALGGVPVVIEVKVTEAPPHRIYAEVTGASQVARFYGADLEIWGNPADPVHDPVRGECVKPVPDEEGNFSRGECEAGIEERPYLALPTSCAGPLVTDLAARSWQDAETWVTETTETHDDSIPPEPLGLDGCGELGFTPKIEATPTTEAADSSSGFDFDLDLGEEGAHDPHQRVSSNLARTEVTLPEGFSTNPSLAEGLAACSEAQLADETADAAPGEGCPQASKIGSVEVESPAISDPLFGSLYVATPLANAADDSLLALYLVIKSAKYGIAVKQALKVETDPATGRITTVAEEVPQLPLSHFKLRFREGPRGPLTTPSGCGTYKATAVLTPSSGTGSVTTDSMFEIETGPAGGPCPADGTGPLTPDLEAGTDNPIAGAYSPFVFNLRRDNGTQPIATIDAVLPPGLTGKLAGVAECSEAQIAQAASRSGPLQGALEEASPSCPLASEVGTVWVGAGSGALAYVRGRAYLAGPYRGAPLSLVIVTPAISGPFDLGTVVVRTAFHVDPNTAQVHAVSDPIPQILQGIPLGVRQISLVMNRPRFMLNPTNCEAMAITGAATSPLGATAPFSERFQVDACAALGFKPKLTLRLKGATGRTGNPALRAELKARGGDANIKGAIVTLPGSQFIDNAHISNPCTRTQFAANACPKRSVLGRARVFTPLLDEPLEGPVYFRSNGGERLLPDVVADLRGKIRFTLVIAILKAKKARVKSKVLNAPDAPVSKVVLKMAGGKRGLFENSEDLCSRPQRATINLLAQNGRRYKTRPLVKTPSCGKKRKGSSRLHRR